MTSTSSTTFNCPLSNIGILNAKIVWLIQQFITGVCSWVFANVTLYCKDVAVFKLHSRYKNHQLLFAIVDSIAYVLKLYVGGCTISSCSFRMQLVYVTHCALVVLSSSNQYVPSNILWKFNEKKTFWRYYLWL